MPRLAWLLLAIALLSAALWRLATNPPAMPETTDPSPRATSPQDAGHPTHPAPINLVAPTPAIGWKAEAVRRLTEKGWTSQAADAVLTLHHDLLAAAHLNEPNGAFERILIHLEKVEPAENDLNELLTRQPELTGLFLLVDDRRALANQFAGLSEADGDLLTSVFLAHLSPASANAVAQALPGNRDLILRLIREGLVGAEALFIFDRGKDNQGTPATRAYEEWLRRVIVKNGLNRTEEEPEDLFLFVLAEGTNIRDRMTDKSFRSNFEVQWERFAKLVETQHKAYLKSLAPSDPRRDDPTALPGFTDLVGVQGIWEFLDEPRHEELFRTRGVLAVELLTGSRKVLPTQRGWVIDVLRHDDLAAGLLLEATLKPALRQFIDVQLEPRLMSAVAADLGSRLGENRTERVAFLRGKLAQGGVNALRMALGPPPDRGAVEYLPGYSVYRVFEGIAAGENPSAEDLVFAAVDLGSVALPAGKVVTTLGKTEGKTAAKQAAEVAVQKRLGGQALKGAGDVVLNRSTATLVARSKTQQGAKSVRTVLGVKLAAPRMEVDITAAVRFAFVNLPLGRESFKKLTRLEARLFMRSDARVVLKLHWAAVPIVTKVREWVKNVLEKKLERWVEEGTQVPEEIRNSFPTPEEFLSRKAWAESAGLVLLSAACDLLPE